MMTKRFACQQCGIPYEAIPLDEVYTMAMIKECYVCKWNNLSIIEANYECDNCSFRNKIYWHKPTQHLLVDKKMARINHEKKLGIYRDTFQYEKIDLNPKKFP